MASEKGVLASGLESDSQAARRRNVPSTSSNGGTVNRVEIDDKKTQIKKVRPEQMTCMLLQTTLGNLSLTCADLSVLKRKSKHY